MKKRTIALLCAAMMVVGIAAGGTLAWLVSNSEPVTNTFTTSDITVTLTETTGDKYKMVPGYTIKKDPTVTLKAGSEKSYVFVKVEKSSNVDSFLTYDMASGWTALDGVDGVDGVYYRVVDASEEDQRFSVLANDQVKVKDNVTKAEMAELTSETYPKLTFTAYASQFMKNNDENFTPAEAWNNLTAPTT